MADEEREKLELEFEKLYNKITNRIFWSLADLDRLLEVYLKLNQD